MSTYLIDYENVKSAGLAGINHIRKEDSVHLFWSSRENKISIEMMELIRSSESEIVMHKAFTGEKDALDHQLCSYFGYLAGAEGELDFIIVSNDRAYDRLIEFWGMMKPEIRIRRVTEIARVSEATENSEIFSEIEDASMDGSGEGRSNRNARRRGSRYLRGGKNNFGRKNRNQEMTPTEEQQTETSVFDEEQKLYDEVTESMENSASFEATRAVTETEDHFDQFSGPDDEKKADGESVLSAETEKEETVKEEQPVKTEKPENVLKAERTGRRNRNRRSGSNKKNEIRSVAEQEYEVPVSDAAVVAETSEVYAVEKTEESQVSPSSSFVLNVISGIKTGIVVESGYTADGILDGKYDSRKSAVKETVIKEITDEPAKAEETAEEAAKEAAEEAVKAEESEEAAEEAVELEKSEEAAEEAVKAEESEEEAEEAVKAEEPEEEAAEEAVETEEPEEEAEEAVKAEESEEEAEEAVKAEESEEEAAVAVELEKSEEAAEEAPENSVKTRQKPAEAEGDDGKPVNPKKKTARRGRPPKKTKPVGVQEKKAVVSLQDVIANCAEAEGADWAVELVNRINSSGDKKELYAATVKLLGQEKGRTIYHMIKGLK